MCAPAVQHPSPFDVLQHNDGTTLDELKDPLNNTTVQCNDPKRPVPLAVVPPMMGASVSPPTTKHNPLFDAVEHSNGTTLNKLEEPVCNTAVAQSLDSNRPVPLSSVPPTTKTLQCSTVERLMDTLASPPASKHNPLFDAVGTPLDKLAPKNKLEQRQCRAVARCTNDQPPVSWPLSPPPTPTLHSTVGTVICTPLSPLTSQHRPTCSVVQHGPVAPENKVAQRHVAPENKLEQRQCQAVARCTHDQPPVSWPVVLPFTNDRPWNNNEKIYDGTHPTTTRMALVTNASHTSYPLSSVATAMVSNNGIEASLAKKRAYPSLDGWSLWSVTTVANETRGEPSPAAPAQTLLFFRQVKMIIIVIQIFDRAIEQVFDQNITALHMKAALEAVSSIGDVNVIKIMQQIWTGPGRPHMRYAECDLSTPQYTWIRGGTIVMVILMLFVARSKWHKCKPSKRIARQQQAAATATAAAENVFQQWWSTTKSKRRRSKRKRRNKWKHRKEHRHSPHHHNATKKEPDHLKHTSSLPKQSKRSKTTNFHWVVIFIFALLFVVGDAAKRKLNSATSNKPTKRPKISNDREYGAAATLLELGNADGNDDQEQEQEEQEEQEGQ